VAARPALASPPLWAQRPPALPLPPPSASGVRARALAHNTSPPVRRCGDAARLSVRGCLAAPGAVKAVPPAPLAPPPGAPRFRRANVACMAATRPDGASPTAPCRTIVGCTPMPPRHAPPQPRAAGRRRRGSSCRAACFAYSGCALSKRHDHSCAAGCSSPRWPHSGLLWLHSGSCLCCVRPAGHHAARVGRRGRMRRSLRRASKQSRDESEMRHCVPGLRCSGRPWRRDAVFCGFAVGG